MNIVAISPDCSVFERINMECQVCKRPATTIIKAPNMIDFYVCDECKSNSISSTIVVILGLKRNK